MGVEVEPVAKFVVPDGGIKSILAGRYDNPGQESTTEYPLVRDYEFGY